MHLVVLKKKVFLINKTGHDFLTNILEMGGSKEPMELFIAFRGREPEVGCIIAPFRHYSLVSRHFGGAAALSWHLTPDHVLHIQSWVRYSTVLLQRQCYRVATHAGS